MSLLQFRRFSLLTAAAVIGIDLMSARAAPQASRYQDPFAQDSRLSDVAWLKEVALSQRTATEVVWPNGRRGFSRSGAYMQLGAIGTLESLAAIRDIEASMARTPLLPKNVNRDHWPAAPPDLSQQGFITPLVESLAPGGTTYRIVRYPVLGGRDLMMTSSRVPADSASWSRPFLVEFEESPPSVDRMTAHPCDVTLTWRNPEIATLRYRWCNAIADSAREITISLRAILQDSDHDGWTDAEERQLGLNPRLADTDADLIPDGQDVCPLFPKPSQVDEISVAIQRAFLAAFGFSGSRDALFPTSESRPVHLFGYGGPVLFNRDPTEVGSRNVSWRVSSQDDHEMVIDMNWGGSASRRSDFFEGPPIIIIGGGGGKYFLKRVLGEWVIVGASYWID
jgi:hypothetical protein